MCRLIDGLMVGSNVQEDDVLYLDLMYNVKTSVLLYSCFCLHVYSIGYWDLPTVPHFLTSLTSI